MLSPINFFIHILLLHRCTAASYGFIYSGCSDNKYQPNTPYETNLNSLLSTLVASSSRALYNALAIGNGTDNSPDSAAFGLFQCRSDLKSRDCSTCIEALINQIQLLCPYNDGATIQLDGCFFRYERTDFIGKLDMSFRHKKCSAGGSNQGDFLQKRDAVLADLMSANGFRIIAAGTVQGFAQCLRDLTAVDCTSCLTEAVEEVKSLCGSAAAADLFLAQCYVRYWESGYSSSSTSYSSEEDGMGKTVAIIIGVVIGAAILVVFLAV